MKWFKKILLFICFCMAFGNAKAQLSNSYHENIHRFQYGFSGKATLEIGNKHLPCNIRFAANAGISSDFLASWSQLNSKNTFSS